MVMRAFWAHPVNDILNGLYDESLRYMYLGDSFVFEAVGLAADRAGEVDVLAQFVMMMRARTIETDVVALRSVALIVAMGVFEADAVFLFARTIVEGVEQVVIDEKGEGTEDCAPIDGRQQTFEVGHGEGVVEVNERLPDHDAHSSGAHVVVLQVLGNLVVHIHYYILWGARPRFFSMLMTIQGA